MFSKVSKIERPPSKTYFPIRGHTLSEDELKKQSDPEKGVMFIKENGFYYNPKTKHFIYYFPEEFIAPCDHDKYIVFQYCRCTVDNHVHAEIEVHADFIPRDQYLNDLVYYANLQVPDDNRKYKVNGTSRTTFEVWFTDGLGNIYDKVKTDQKDEHGEPIYRDVLLNFVMFLKLVY